MNSNEQKGLIRYRTESGSIYEVNYDEKKTRRVSGNHIPTDHQGTDGEWKPFLEVNECDTKDGYYLETIWRVDQTDEGAVIRRTVTSLVVERNNVDR